MAAVNNPDLSGDWGGYMTIVEMRGSGVTNVDTWDREGITMNIQQAGGMATVRIRQAGFGRFCAAPYLSNFSPCSSIGVCPYTVEIPLDASCNSTIFNRGFSADVYRGLKVAPYMLDPERDFHMGSDTIHMTFWTHTCRNDGGSGSTYVIDPWNHERHWALWMDTAGPVNMPYLEVRYMLKNKDRGNPDFETTHRRWFVAGSLERC